MTVRADIVQRGPVMRELGGVLVDCRRIFSVTIEKVANPGERETAFAALMDSQIPQPGDPYSSAIEGSYPTMIRRLVCVDRVVEEVDSVGDDPSKFIYSIQCIYRDQPIGQNWEFISGGSGIRQVATSQDRLGRPIIVGHAGSGDNARADTAGVEMNLPQATFSVTGVRWHQCFNPAVIAAYWVNTVNEAEWKGVLPGNALCTDTSYELAIAGRIKTGAGYESSKSTIEVWDFTPVWRFAFEFCMIDENAPPRLGQKTHLWQPTVAYRDRNTREVPPNLKPQGDHKHSTQPQNDDKGVKVIDWYRAIDFNEFPGTAGGESNTKGEREITEFFLGPPL